MLKRFQQALPCETDRDIPNANYDLGRSCVHLLCLTKSCSTPSAAPVTALTLFYGCSTFEEGASLRPTAGLCIALL